MCVGCEVSWLELNIANKGKVGGWCVFVVIQLLKERVSE